MKTVDRLEGYKEIAGNMTKLVNRGRSAKES